jgi:hypothetical protein
MPVELFDKEEFVELSKSASGCKVKKNKDNTKLKLRKGRYIYTIKLEPEEADKIVSRLGCATVQI